MATGSRPTISSFGSLVRRARRTAGLTQEELAEHAGLSVRTISDIERGINQAPHLTTLELLADALDVPAGEREEWSRVRQLHASRTKTLPSELSEAARGREMRLPSVLTSFVGRTREIATLTRLLRRHDVRLVSLTGTGGVGKTRLALAVARELTDDYRDGVQFIDLAPLTDATLVLPTIATALNVQPTASRPVDAVLTAHLRTKQTLLVLDNFEQVVDAAPQIGRLVATCPSLILLITSRVPLHIRGEHEYPVPPLTVPEQNGQTPDIEKLSRSDAVSLLVQRTQAVRPDFVISPEIAPVTIALCRRLGGIPLMIELAAARLRSLPIDGVLARLDHSLSLLKSQTRDVPLRQQTLRATIEWSYNLLTDEEQRVFRRVGVFHGGFTLAAAAAVTQRDGEMATLDVLEPLIEHGLIQPQTGESGTPRYTMLEMLREYALEQLRERGEEETARELHAKFFLQFAEEAQQHLQAADQTVWITTLEEEHSNLRAAMGWISARTIAGDAVATTVALRLGAALWWFWFTRGHLRESREFLDAPIRMGRALLAAPPDGMDPIDLARIFAAALLAFTTIFGWMAEYDRAKAQIDECLEIYQRIDDEQGIANALVFKSYALNRTGEYELAERLLDEGIAHFRRLDDRAGVALGLLGFSEMALRRGDYVRGEERTEECLALYTELGDVRATTAASANLGALRLCQGDPDAAATLLRDSLAVRYRLGDQGGMAWSLEWLARLALEESTPPAGPTRAAKLLGAARQLREVTGSEIDPADQPSYDLLLASVQRQLTDAAFVVAWEVGRAMPLERVVAFGLEGGQSTDPRASVKTTLTLSRREAEVLKLVAEGLSDREIADLIHVSPRTVNTHVTHILNKLGVMSRTAAATKAVRMGLI